MYVSTREPIDGATVVPSLDVLLGALGRMYRHHARTVIDAVGQLGEMTV